jgi:DNA-directed RNA polymerase specialized sigma24 family protein
MNPTSPISPAFWNLMAQAELPPALLFHETDTEMWHYRIRTIKLLRRYARASVEIGRLPSQLGRECFRSRIAPCERSNFEDLVIFVTDMERAISTLEPFGQRLLAMNVLEDYGTPEVGGLLGLPQRTVERLLQEALDCLSRTLLGGGLMER